jgi:hypothetical protein
VEQELLTLPEHLSSTSTLSGVRVTRSLILYVCFVDRCLSFCTFSFWPLCCLFFFDIRILIALLLSSDSSYGIPKGQSKIGNLEKLATRRTKTK